jgi:hypothetical protein
MFSFRQFINENYKNFIGPNSIEGRRKWADQAWDILQKSYIAIGGIKASGFASKEDMINNIPFWKIYVKNDRVIAAAFYKDKGGRKSVAIATDGSDEGSKIVDNIFKSSLGTSFGEKSGRALGKFVKAVEWSVLEPYLLKPDVVQKLTGDDLIPIAKFDLKKLDDKDRFTYDKYPRLHPYMYVRELGGEMHLKVSIGTPNLKIFTK